MMERLARSPIAIAIVCALLVGAQAQQDTSGAPPSQQQNPPAPQSQTPPAPQPQTSNAPAQQTPLPSAPSAPSHLNIKTPSNLAIPHSDNPFRAYAPSLVAKPDLANSPRLEQLMRDGKLYISLQNAIDLALENNLDLAIARYNLPIADTDIQRTKAGGSFRGVNTGVIQGTVGGGVGGYGAGAPGAGAGGTTGGAGGAGAGAAGLVQSTLGIGTNVSSYDPILSGVTSLEHQTLPLSNIQIYGVPKLQTNTGLVNLNYSQAFPTGTSFSLEVDNGRQTSNSIFNSLLPTLNSFYRFTIQQQLLAGFGTGPNKRFIRIAKNNKKISDIAFKSQVIATVTQIADIYWDLVSAYQAEKVNEQSFAFAQQSLESARKQLQLEAIPAMDVMRAEAEVSRRDQDLTVAKTNLQLQESLLKNALTRNLDDPTLEAMPVIPTDTLETVQEIPERPTADLITQALRTRSELSESDIDLQNREITRKAAANALLPTLTLVGFYGGSGLAGDLNPFFTLPNPPLVPTNWYGALQDAWNNTSPDYLVGLNLSVPIRNRVAKADQYRSELEYRQAELREQELKKQIRIEVRNAEYALEQGRARVEAAKKARDLAERTFTIMQKEQTLGAGSSFQTLTAQRDLALAELDLVNASTAYQKSKLELQRSTGTTLEDNNIQIQNAVDGVAR
ncbi:MAG TPA: TolC family protein [Terriglobales bacterium]|nr:TolC family protein [Terriglobales bacterium]